jgi:predicted amidohydrolase
MRRKITIAAAQLAGIPDEFTKGIQAKELNNLMIRGGEKERREAEKILSKIEVDDIRKYSISRMIGLMQEASEQGCGLVVFPELALTSFFPYFYIEAEQLLLRFFEREPIQCGVAKPLFDYAQKRGVSFSFGYAEYVSSSRYQHYQRYNTYILVDKKGSIYKYRKTHIPGFEKPRPGEDTFQFEKSQFHSSQAGYPVFDSYLTQRNSEPVDVKVGMLICHDRRYNAPFLIMGMPSRMALPHFPC